MTDRGKLFVLNLISPCFQGKKNLHVSEEIERTEEPTLGVVAAFFEKKFPIFQFDVGFVVPGFMMLIKC